MDVLLFLLSFTHQIQSWVRMSLARKKYLERSKYFKDHVRISTELALLLEFAGGGGILLVKSLVQLNQRMNKAR